VSKATTPVAGIATSQAINWLFDAVVFAEPLLIQKRTNVAALVPDAVAPLVLVKRTVIVSTRAPFAPAVNAKAKAVPAVSVPSKALVLVIAVERTALFTPKLGVNGKMGVVLAGI
jgi:hypothetical protein